MGFYTTPSSTTTQVIETGLYNNSPVDIAVEYRNAADAYDALSSGFTADTLKLALNDGFVQQIAAGSVRFNLGNSSYTDRNGTLYRDIDPKTGSGTAAGQIFYGTGNVEITDWNAGQSNNPVLQSLVTQFGGTPVSVVAFRTALTPLRVQSLTITAALQDGTSINVSANSAGVISHPKVTGTVNWEQGIVELYFATKTKITSANRPNIEAKDWYDASMEYTEGSDTYINVPNWVLPETIKYSAVAYSYLPLSADLLGLDPVRLPSDGRVPIFRLADVIVVHHTASENWSNPAINGSLSMGRGRLAYIKLYDSTGKVVDPNMYDVDLDLGEVTLNSNYSAAGLALPLIAEHRIEDAAMALDVQINGTIRLNKPLTHNFPAGSMASSALMMGDIQGRAFNVFSQASWTNEWSDTRIGNPINAQYNDALYPIITINRGVIEERWALIFTSTTAYRVVGEYSGQIGTGDINYDYSPQNPVTLAPYFTIKKEGWGSGWPVGAVLRLETAAASYPVDVARTILQGEGTLDDDSFQIQIRCGVDR
ncbi:hypothetical protein [Alkanindiges illinoisensis]|uniref:hypothetical protein n=1 Tax=Alkanindiges illinoisensis TaxID=197183 RepID=UPI00047AD335|nr:hypothetical protein [Alkanindiges illinoisensis]